MWGFFVLAPILRQSVQPALWRLNRVTRTIVCALHDRWMIASGFDDGEITRRGVQLKEAAADASSLEPFVSLCVLDRFVALRAGRAQLREAERVRDRARLSNSG
jgi:hypothetical protein